MAARAISFGSSDEAPDAIQFRGNDRSMINTWRAASQIVGRRTALRYFGSGVVTAIGLGVVSACGGSVAGARTPSGIAMTKFMAATWKVTGPQNAHWKSGTVTIRPDGTWTGAFANGDSTDQKSGTWTINGATLKATMDDEALVGEGLPSSIAGGEQAKVSWELVGQGPALPVKAAWDDAVKTLTLTTQPNDPRVTSLTTIAVRQ